MRLTIIIVIMLFISCGTYHTDADELQLGKPIPISAKSIDTASFSNFILYRPNDFKPSRIISYNGVFYNVCLDTSKNVIFIFTNDKRFLSRDGFRVGDVFSNLTTSNVVNKKFISGYGIEIMLSSDWTATFSDALILEKGDVFDTSTIKSFYKRLE